MDRSKTVIDTKSAFLRSQVRLLTASLQPSAQWRAFCPETIEGDLSNKVISTAMTKVNDAIKQHSRAVYSSQSQRHVAEQIDALYWDVVSREDISSAVDTTIVKKDVDLTTTEGCSYLPERYEELFLRESHELDDDEKRRYELLKGRLESLLAKRREQEMRVARYKNLQEMVRPFEDIQPNLLVEGGELDGELERMRVLLGRLAGRVEGFGKERGKGELAVDKGKGMSRSDEQRLQDVMDLT